MCQYAFHIVLQTSGDALMISAALLSAWIPARRALAVAPADALRSE